MSKHKPAWTVGGQRCYVGDALDRLRELPDESVHCCVTSPPYWGLRDYGCEGQIGLEGTPEAFIARLVEGKLGRAGIGIELNPEYAAMAKRRVAKGLKPGTFVDQSREVASPLFGGPTPGGDSGGGS